LVAFVSIVLALSLLGLIVYALHRHQTMEVEYNVDRTMPLPPIAGRKRGKHQRDSLGQITSGKPTGSRVRSNNRKSAETGNQTETSSNNRASPKAGWQDQVAAAKDAGDFELAYAVCRQQFPLWSAFNQACICIRTQIKSANLPKEATEKLLERLYRTAALGELLHDKSEHAESFKLHQLRGIDLSALEQLELPYKDIGYAQLRLIRKSDVKLMLSAWGRPDAHLLPRQFHSQWWESQVGGLRAG